MDTHPLSLAEATSEKPWGCGLSLNHANVSDPKHSRSQGVMGTTLERVRAELLIDFGMPDKKKTPALVPIPVSQSASAPEATQNALGNN